MKYILNSAVITTAGIYEYRIINVEQAKKWIEQNTAMNTIGYQETCDAMNTIFGTDLKMNRTQIKMQVGDEALVFRLTCRMNDPELKGKMTTDFVLNNCEIGLLKKIGGEL